MKTAAVEQIRSLEPKSGTNGLLHIAGDSHAWTEHVALVGHVLARDPDRNRLQALEACRRLKVRTLFAAMQRGIALGAGSFEVDASRERRGAVITARSRYALHQPGQAGPGDVDGGTRSLRLAWLLLIAVAMMMVAGLIVSGLLVLTISVHEFENYSLSDD